MRLRLILSFALVVVIAVVSFVVIVRDTGPGIPDEALPHHFDRFYKVDKSRREHSDTGLGLAIARKLTQALGGNLTASNHPAGGAVFTLHL